VPTADLICRHHDGEEKAVCLATPIDPIVDLVAVLPLSFPPAHVDRRRTTEQMPKTSAAVCSAVAPAKVCPSLPCPHPMPPHAWLTSSLWFFLLQKRWVHQNFSVRVRRDLQQRGKGKEDASTSTSLSMNG
jgi:hypothetical protein